MAEIKRREPLKAKATSKTVKTTVKSKKRSAGVTLPTSKRQPTQNIADFTWLIYGDKKIGKTSLCSMFPGALIYSFEPGVKSLEVFAVDIPSWDVATEYNEQLFEGDHEFENVVIDTGKIAYDRNMQYVCEASDIEHPGDLGYGKGWNKVNKSFEKFHLDITNNGLGLIVVAHEKIEEIEKASGLKVTKIGPDLSGSSLNFYQGLVDIIGHYQYIGSKRFLTIRGDENEVAGCRMNKNFLTPDGEPIVRIPMGESEAEAYENLIAAFNNKQTETYADARAIAHETKPATNIKRKLKR